MDDNDPSLAAAASPANTNLPWYDRTGWIVTMLFLFFPLGLFMMWRARSFTQLQAIAISLLIVPMILSVLTLPPPSIRDLIEGSINSFTLFFGFTLLLWGLALFKFYIRLIGAIVGFIVGALLGVLLQGEPWATGLILAIVGAMIAWRLQLFMVFITAGFYGTLIILVVYAAWARRPDNDVMVPLGLASFIGCGIIAVKLYDYFVIICMAATAVFSLMALATPQNPIISMLQELSSRSPFRRFTSPFQMYIDHYALLLFLLATLVPFAVYFQKTLRVDKLDSEHVVQKKSLIRQIVLTLAVLTYFSYNTRFLYGEAMTHALAFTLFPLHVWILYKVSTQTQRLRKFGFLADKMTLVNYIVGLACGLVILPLANGFMNLGLPFLSRRLSRDEYVEAMRRATENENATSVNDWVFYTFGLVIFPMMYTAFMSNPAVRVARPAAMIDSIGPDRTPGTINLTPLWAWFQARIKRKHAIIVLSAGVAIFLSYFLYRVAVTQNQVMVADVKLAEATSETARETPTRKSDEAAQPKKQERAQPVTAFTHYVSGVTADVNDPYLNARSGPSVQFNIVRKLEEGTRVIVLQRGLGKKGIWCKIRYSEDPASEGYVNGTFLKGL